MNTKKKLQDLVEYGEARKAAEHRLGYAMWESGIEVTPITKSMFKGLLDAAQHYEQHRQARIAEYDQRQR